MSFDPAYHPKRNAILRAKLCPCADCGRRPTEPRLATLDHTGPKRMQLGGRRPDARSGVPHWTEWPLDCVLAELAACVPVCIWCHDRREQQRGRLGPIGVRAARVAAALRRHAVVVEHPADLGPQRRAAFRAVGGLL